MNDDKVNDQYDKSMIELVEAKWNIDKKYNKLDVGKLKSSEKIQEIIIDLIELNSMAIKTDMLNSYVNEYEEFDL